MPVRADTGRLTHRAYTQFFQAHNQHSPTTEGKYHMQISFKNATKFTSTVITAMHNPVSKLRKMRLLYCTVL